MKNAIITGITGQDGAYLAELLLKNGYNVIGTYREGSSGKLWRLSELGILDHPSLRLIKYDYENLESAISIIDRYEPDEIYNLAALSSVGLSFVEPIVTAKVTGIGPLYLLEAIRTRNVDIRFYQASTCEIFGKAQKIPQDESTAFYPKSPYGVSKLFAHWLTINYRESYNLFACSGILFNHESPLRGTEFVTRKITDSVAKIKYGKLDILRMGNIDAKRDWGYAKEYVEGMWRIISAETPSTYILATNRTESVRYFLTTAFSCIGVDLIWQGIGLEERGIDRMTGKALVSIDPAYYRPSEVDILLGDSGKAKVELGWKATTTMEELCGIMMEADLRRNSCEA